MERTKNIAGNINNYMTMEKAVESFKEIGDTKALRYNEGKPQFSLIDLNKLEPMARVLEFGAKKYARDNWKSGFKFTKLLDSLLRHVAALERGEWLDPESGEPHIGHIQCNAMFMGLLNNEIDIPTLQTEYEEWKTQHIPTVPYTT